MSAKTRPWQKTMEIVDGLKGKLPDEELAVIKRYVERRSREAAQVTVTPVSTVQLCIPRSLNPEMPPDICINLESNEGKMDPELKELESPSAGTGLETPGQQCPPNEGTWETGRTTANGFLTAGVGLNLGKHTSSTTERVDTRAVRTTTANITFLQQGHKTKDKEKGSEENKQFDPGGEGGKQPPPWNAAVMVVFSFPQGSAGPGVPAGLCFVLFSCLLCSVIIVPFR